MTAPVPTAGAWATGDLGSLESVLAQGLGTSPPVLLDAVPASTTAVAPAAQASTYAAAIGAASCLSDVSGVLLDRLVDDGAAPGAATGLYDANGDAKPSARAVGQAIRTVA